MMMMICNDDVSCVLRTTIVFISNAMELGPAPEIRFKSVRMEIHLRKRARVD